MLQAKAEGSAASLATDVELLLKELHSRANTQRSVFRELRGHVELSAIDLRDRVATGAAARRGKQANVCAAAGGASAAAVQPACR